MNYHMRILMTGAAAVLLCPAASALAEHNDAPNGVPVHHLVPPEPYAAKAMALPVDKKLELREYLDYEQREPCQNYQKPPQPFIKDGCELKVREKVMPHRHVVQTRTETVTTIRGLRPVIADYKIYFDFDRFNIRESEEATLRKVTSEIKTYQPYEATIAGYADRSGPNDYNFALSRKRADSVSQALTALGIPNRVLDEEAHGEEDPAVPTPDGVKLEENRRVEIQFRK
jgi:outer membrane protein OmpA-like peptidoglycan-associated protein